METSLQDQFPGNLPNSPTSKSCGCRLTSYPVFQFLRFSVDLIVGNSYGV
jgi:hypothetical protein